MVSVLLPMGDSPYFVRACLDNFYETCGVEHSSVDFHLLTVDPMSPAMAAAVAEAGRRHRLSVHARPFGRKRDKAHMRLLDWAISDLKLHEWVYVTHADMFWADEGWMAELLAATRGNVTACMLPPSQYRGHNSYMSHKYEMGGVPLVRTHDFAGLYRTGVLKDMGLEFVCGHIGTDVAISQGLRSAISDGLIHWVQPARPLVVGDMADGSDIIGLELAVHRPGSVVEPPIKSRFVHAWDTLGLADDIERDGDELIVHRRTGQCHRGLNSYSWVSSFLYGPGDGAVFPWGAFVQFARAAGFSTAKTAFCDIVQKYADPAAKRLGPTNTMGVKKLRFMDGAYSIHDRSLMLI